MNFTKKLIKTFGTHLMYILMTICLKYICEKCCFSLITTSYFEGSAKKQEGLAIAYLKSTVFVSISDTAEAE